MLEVREWVRLYLDLLATKQAEQQIHATLFQHGVPKVAGRLLARGRADRGRDDPDLSDAGREAVDTELRVIAGPPYVSRSPSWPISRSLGICHLYTELHVSTDRHVRGAAIPIDDSASRLVGSGGQ